VRRVINPRSFHAVHYTAPRHSPPLCLTSTNMSLHSTIHCSGSGQQLARITSSVSACNRGGLITCRPGDLAADSDRVCH
jgi:hypothetical protein